MKVMLSHSQQLQSHGVLIALKMLEAEIVLHAFKYTIEHWLIAES